MREIDVDQLEDVLAAGGTVVDVREPMEYAEAHVPGAVLIPMGQLSSRIGELDRSGPVYLICRTGHRSGVVGEALEAHGFDTVNVTGGTIAWVRAGKSYDQGLE
jgi:rhodanese-related sulfurtransferase